LMNKLFGFLTKPAMGTAKAYGPYPIFADLNCRFRHRRGCDQQDCKSD